MARLVDQLYSSDLIAPSVYLVNRFTGGDYLNLPVDPQAVGEQFHRYRNRIRQCPVVAIDAAVAFYFRCPRQSPLMPNRDLASLHTPHPSFFLETARPSTAPRYLPPYWGYFIEPVPDEDWASICARRGGEPVPGFQVVAAHLFAATSERAVTGILATHILPLDAETGRYATSELPSDYLEDVPTEYRPPAESVEAYLKELYLPVLFAWSLMNAPMTKRKSVTHPPALQKKRKKSGRREFFAYDTLDPGDAINLLRYDGRAGIEGIAPALRQCLPSLLPAYGHAGGRALVWTPEKGE